VLIALAGAVGAVVLFRRRRRPREHVDLYYGDGSMVSFAPGSVEGDRLVPLARRVLAAAQG
jgi:hypothetical protein